VAAGSLEVSGHRLPDEDPWSRLLEGPATDDRSLAGRLAPLGIRYVVVFDGPESDAAARTVAGLPVVRSFPDLRLYRVPGPVRIPAFDGTPAAPVVAGDVAAAALVLVAGAMTALAFVRRRRPGSADRLAGAGPEPPAMLAPNHDAGGRQA